MVVDCSIVHLAHTAVGVIPVVVNGDDILNFGFGGACPHIFLLRGEGEMSQVEWFSEV